jgi:hypothetical protein
MIYWQRTLIGVLVILIPASTHAQNQFPPIYVMGEPDGRNSGDVNLPTPEQWLRSKLAYDITVSQ